MNEPTVEHLMSLINARKNEADKLCELIAGLIKCERCKNYGNICDYGNICGCDTVNFTCFET